jgi:hypothetical protein
LARAFLELARHRLPGSTFDSLLQEALTACGPSSAHPLEGGHGDSELLRFLHAEGGDSDDEDTAHSLPVVLTAED